MPSTRPKLILDEDSFQGLLAAEFTIQQYNAREGGIDGALSAELNATLGLTRASKSEGRAASTEVKATEVKTAGARTLVDAGAVKTEEVRKADSRWASRSAWCSSRCSASASPEAAARASTSPWCAACRAPRSLVKLLYDKLELDTLPGRLTLGVLVIQDIYAIFILAFQPNFSSPHAGAVLHALLCTVLLLAAGFALSLWVLRPVFTAIAKAPEMVVAVSIGWCALVAGGAGALGLSMEMGALVAGLSISAFPYSLHVTAKTLPLRDFFLTLFFMSLGMKLTAPRLDMAGTVAVVVAFTIASRVLSVYPLLAFSGAGRRSAFITALNLSQISEFFLVIAALGVTYRHIARATVAVIIYAMAITAVISSYAIRYNHRPSDFRNLTRSLTGSPGAGFGYRRTIVPRPTSAKFGPTCRIGAVAFVVGAKLQKGHSHVEGRCNHVHVTRRLRR